MTKEEIKKQLTVVFQKTFSNDNLQIQDKMTANDVEGWDSLAHINLIVAVEKSFGVTFSTREIRRLENVGALLKIIEEKTP